jgi:hypothetical protein
MLACFFLFAYALSASATKINIYDPPGGFTTYPVTTSPFDVTFSACGANELPDPNIPADGCFAGLNRTGSAWSALTLVVPKVGQLANQDMFCNTDGFTYQIFSNASCTYDRSSNDYSLVFSTGSLTNGEFFIIAEEGVVPPEDFPPMTAYVSYAVSPEPSSVLLMSTGMLCMAYLFWSRRRAEARI